MNSWKERTDRRQCARIVIGQMVDKLTTEKIAYATMRWKQYTIRLVSVIEIQRVGRGYIGRTSAYRKYRTIQAAISIQQLYKNRSFFTKYSRNMKLYSGNVIAIQVKIIVKELVVV